MRGAVGRVRMHPLAFYTLIRRSSKRGVMRCRLLNFFVGWATPLGPPLKASGYFLFLTLPLNVAIGKAVAATNRISALPGPVPSL